ncbi:GT-D fold domain-containing glycosyltransferase [Faecalibacillus intestinalis]|uniref:GT-D fold domain-containing glycosyltransferase n=1 Tax=Faecalibacillus intestinalis TaxID=1982626 RepID=UPI0035225315
MLQKRIIIWIKVLFNYFSSFKKLKCIILDSENTVGLQLETKKSLIRFGDGEFNLLNKKDVHYQKYSLELASELKKILLEYSIESNYIIAVPYYYFSNNNTVLNNRLLISCWSIPKTIFKKNMQKNVPYGDAFLFSKNNKKIKIFEKIWENYTNIVFVHNNEIYTKAINLKKNQKLFYVKVPNKNAYEKIENIQNDIEMTFILNDLLKSNSIILISAGPAAKVLVYSLSKKGFLCIDTGHCWDDPLEVK